MGLRPARISAKSTSAHYGPEPYPPRSKQSESRLLRHDRREARGAGAAPTGRRGGRRLPGSPASAAAPRRIGAGAIKASPPPIGSGGSPDELPAALPPKARRRRQWRDGCGFSLGVDLGEARTGVAVGRGITLPRPLTVLKLRGQKLELMLLDIARQQVELNSTHRRFGRLNSPLFFSLLLQEADELTVGLPVSADGSETPQTNKVRSIVGRLAVQAADRGLREFLQDEHGTSIDALGVHDIQGSQEVST